MQTQLETARHDAPGYRTLVAFEGFSVREAAAVFHISVQAVYKRLKKIGRLLYG